MKPKITKDHLVTPWGMKTSVLPTHQSLCARALPSARARAHAHTRAHTHTHTVP